MSSQLSDQPQSDKPCSNQQADIVQSTIVQSTVAEFYPVSMTVHRDCALRASEALEGEGIPFIIEHVDLVREGHTVPGYRMLVDSRHLQKGIFLVSTTITKFEVARYEGSDTSSLEFGSRYDTRSQKDSSQQAA